MTFTVHQDWVVQTSGIPFSPHDRRRSFATVAEGLDLPVYATKRLMNHMTGATDLTGGYLQINAERLRVPMQRITDTILAAAGRRGSNVVSLTPRTQGIPT